MGKRRLFDENGRFSGYVDPTPQPRFPRLGIVAFSLFWAAFFSGLVTFILGFAQLHRSPHERMDLTTFIILFLVVWIPVSALTFIAKVRRFGK